MCFLFSGPLERRKGGRQEGGKGERETIHMRPSAPNVTHLVIGFKGPLSLSTDRDRGREREGEGRMERVL